MKGLSPTGLDVTATVVRDGDGWEVRVFNRITGDGPIGPRLGRGDGMPDIPVRAETRTEADQHRDRWQQFLDKRPIRKRKRR